MQRLINLKLGTKIYGVVALLSLVALAIAALALSGMRTYNQLTGEMERASQRAVIAEQINTLVFAVVMDSRGIYMSRDRAEAEKFGKPLLQNLAKAQKLTEEWHSLLTDDR